MPNNRKAKFIINSSKVSHASLNNETRGCQARSNVDDLQMPSHFGGSGRLTMPKHISLPPIPLDGEMLFETIMFGFTTLAMCLQYLNLYRTVWWLPHSHNKYAVNFHLIDLHLLSYIAVILGRRFIWCFLRSLLNLMVSPTTKAYLVPFLQKMTRFILCTALIWLIWCIAWKHPIVKMLYLLYPFCIYVMVFSTNISAFFEIIQSRNSAEDKLNKPKTCCENTSTVQHICTQNADVVRKEVEFLKTDFNNRLKQVLFNSLLSTYYAGFIPCCFAQSVLYYDSHWMTQQLVCLWLSSFTMYVIYIFSPQYCNVLHCSALHLGRWHKVEGPATHMPHTPWSDAVVWQQGSLVKHRKELFRAEGVSNAAEPGNTAHCRFYIFFRDPSSILCGIVGLQVTLLVSQIILLTISKEWNYVISHTLLISMNYYTLFKLIRDYFVLFKMYKTEDILQHKIAGN